MSNEPSLFMRLFIFSVFQYEFADSRILGGPASAQGIVNFVVAKLLLELANVRFGVDNGDFDVGNGHKVFEHFSRDRLAKTGVMGSTGIDPRGGRALQIRLRRP